MLQYTTDFDWDQTQWNTVLVCGAGGFIGSQVVRRLLTRGLRVIALDDLSLCRSWDRLSAHADSLARVTGDLLDRDLLCLVCEGVDTIVHCAGIDVAWPSAAPQDLVAVTVNGTLNLVDAACACHCRRLIRVSTILPPDAGDDLPLQAAHRLADSMITQASWQPTLKWLVLRTPEVYGPRQEAVHPSVTPMASLLHNLRQQVVPLICGDLDMPRDWLHIADLTTAIEKACFLDLASHATVELGSGHTYSMQNILSFLRSRGVQDAHRIRMSDQLPVFASCPSPETARRLLDFRPQRDILGVLEAALPSLELEE